jgi:hypothetical protein
VKVIDKKKKKKLSSKGDTNAVVQRQSIEEKRLNLHQDPLAIFKTYIISFPPKTPQKVKMHHLHTETLRVLPTVHQQANNLTTRLGTIQDSPKRVEKKKIYIYIGTNNLAMKKNSVYGLPILLHIYHLSTTMICRFPRLSIVRIFPMAAEQVKKLLSNEP